MIKNVITLLICCVCIIALLVGVLIGMLLKKPSGQADASEAIAQQQEQIDVQEVIGMVESFYEADRSVLENKFSSRFDDLDAWEEVLLSTGQCEPDEVYAHVEGLRESVAEWDEEHYGIGEICGYPSMVWIEFDEYDEVYDLYVGVMFPTGGLFSQGSAVEDFKDVSQQLWAFWGTPDYAWGDAELDGDTMEDWHKEWGRLTYDDRLFYEDLTHYYYDWNQDGYAMESHWLWFNLY